MAIIDYGAIALKNGKLISTDMFTDMKETCGFSDEGSPLPGRTSSFDGNCFITIGNEKLLFGFYKTWLDWWYDWGENCTPRYESDSEWFDSSKGFTKWKRWEQGFAIGEGMENWVQLVVKPKNGYYVARFNIGKDKYKVYFGYGVDLGFYERTKRVNYYRSPEYWVKKHIYYPIYNFFYWRKRRKKK